jgi:hypothetical protein
MFVLTTSSALLFTGCQKDLKPTPENLAAVPTPKVKITLPNTVNPFSLRNVQKAKATLATTHLLKIAVLLQALLVVSRSLYILSLILPMYPDCLLRL